MTNEMTNKANVAVIGGVGSGAIMAQALRDIASSGGNLLPYGFLNDVVESGEQIDGLPILGRFEDWAKLPSDTLFVAAIHRPKKAAERYARVVSLEIPDNRWATVIHPSAHLAESATVGVGTYVGPNAVLMPAAQVGKHCSIRAGCYVSHDVQVGDFGFVGPSAILNGRTRLGEGAHVGPGVICREETTIGDYAVIGIGAVVTHDAPDGATMIGNPARSVG